ncbi:hypothetical protein BD410DRAFT_828707 [Rickenella mellea]|uniref:Uncharacterized protein n=1 Tax=Rickenella mellea TaxID=50990 RepID=A0A4Y7Q4X4_9AGAM|nr:hypothetical protein BD410DRAFT_828707 [Rickenella mellea]
MLPGSIPISDSKVTDSVNKIKQNTRGSSSSSDDQGLLIFFFILCNGYSLELHAIFMLMTDGGLEKKEWDSMENNTILVWKTGGELLQRLVILPWNGNLAAVIYGFIEDAESPSHRSVTVSTRLIARDDLE